VDNCVSDLANDLHELHKHWKKDPEFVYTSSKCLEAADEIECQQVIIDRIAMSMLDLESESTRLRAALVKIKFLSTSDAKSIKIASKALNPDD